MLKNHYPPTVFIAWDLGGTLVQLKPSIKKKAARKISAELGTKIEAEQFDLATREEWKAREEPEDLDRIREVRTKGDEARYWVGFFKKTLERLGLHHPSEELLIWLAAMQVDPESWELIEGAKRTIQKLHRLGYPQGVISNAYPSAAAILDKLELRGSFEVVILSYLENTLKPEPDIFSKAIQLAGVRPEEMIFIDDRIKFIEGARAAGIRAVWFNQNGVQGEAWRGDTIMHLSQITDLLRRRPTFRADPFQAFYRFLNSNPTPIGETCPLTLAS